MSRWLLARKLTCAVWKYILVHLLHNDFYLQTYSPTALPRVPQFRFWAAKFLSQKKMFLQKPCFLKHLGQLFIHFFHPHLSTEAKLAHFVLEDLLQPASIFFLKRIIYSHSYNSHASSTAAAIMKNFYKIQTGNPQNIRWEIHSNKIESRLKNKELTQEIGTQIMCTTLISNFYSIK